MNVLRIVLEILIVVGIWVLVELALTIRKTRASVDDITKQADDVATSANETIEQLQPVITKADGILADLEPAVKKVDPLLDKTATVMDVLTVDLASVNDILIDVSSVTDTASNVTSTVSKATNSAVSGVAGVVGKFTGRGGKKSRRHRIMDKSHGEKEQGEKETPSVDRHAIPEIDLPSDEEQAEQHHYVTYGGSDSAQDSE